MIFDLVTFPAPPVPGTLWKLTDTHGRARAERVGCLYAVQIRASATRLTRESADMLIEDGIVPHGGDDYGCDDWPIINQPLDLECVYAPELNPDQPGLPLAYPTSTESKTAVAS